MDDLRKWQDEAKNTYTSGVAEQRAHVPANFDSGYCFTFLGLAITNKNVVRDFQTRFADFWVIMLFSAHRIVRTDPLRMRSTPWRECHAGKRSKP